MSLYFNSVNGIQSALVDLNSLHRLINDRAEYIAANPDKKLKEYVINGQVMLLLNGTITRLVSTTKMKDDKLVDVKLNEVFPGVLTAQQFIKQINKHNISVTYAPYLNLVAFPRNTTVCPHCHKGWLVDMLDDVEHDITGFKAEDIKNNISYEIRKKVADELSLKMILNMEQKIVDLTPTIIDVLNNETGANWAVDVNNFHNKISYYARYNVYHKACFETVKTMRIIKDLKECFDVASIFVYGAIRANSGITREDHNTGFIFDTEYGQISIVKHNNEDDSLYSVYIDGPTGEIKPFFIKLGDKEAITNELKYYRKLMINQ